VRTDHPVHRELREQYSIKEVVNFCMTTSLLGTYSETQQQLQLLGRVFFGPILIAKTYEERMDQYYRARTKLYVGQSNRWNDFFTPRDFWRDMYEHKFIQNVRDVVSENCRGVVAKNKSFTNGEYKKSDTPGYAYHEELVDLIDVCLNTMYEYVDQHFIIDQIHEDLEEMDDQEDFPYILAEAESKLVTLASTLAEDFLHVILFLHAVPQVAVSLQHKNSIDGMTVSKTHVPSGLHRRTMWQYTKEELEKGVEDCTWKLPFCKVYQNNTKFMDFMRNCATVIFFVDTEKHNPHVPLSVISVCKFYAMLARDDMKSRLYQRGMLEKMKKSDSTLQPDEVLEITDHAKYAKHKYVPGHTAMHTLLCQLRKLQG
jgi:hypothetical protein